MLKKVLYGLAIALVVTGMAVTAADSTKAVSPTDSTYTEVNAETVVQEAAETESSDINQLLTAKKSFSFDLVSLLRGILGMVVLIGIGYVFSSNRKAISWKIVIIGLGIQLLLAIAILQFPPVQLFFDFIGKVFVKVLDFSKAGTEFLFPGFLNVETFGFVFAFQVLPTIIFFSALTSLLFYLGVIQ
ncbi:MAG: Na+ dependent nucleoside transporter N-terminal domain-containing protein [Bacteroidales bacterium]|nr:Na+ dependent nucleoside transporter N-terminal domain-containing protein [Bacteroidales bacterium]